MKYKTRNESLISKATSRINRIKFNCICNGYANHLVNSGIFIEQDYICFYVKRIVTEVTAVKKIHLKLFFELNPGYIEIAVPLLTELDCLRVGRVDYYEV